MEKTEETGEGWQISLNCHHTHFLMVDNGYRNIKANADDFRTELEVAIQTILKIPIVVVMVGGDMGTLRRCVQALNRDRPLPVVVVKGTGKAADLLADIISQKDGARHDILSSVGEYMSHLEEESYPECVDLVIRCITQAHYITIFDSSLSLDISILHALLTGTTSYVDQLELALQWDKADIAEAKILPRFETWNKDEEKGRIAEIMEEALLSQSTSFVELLLRMGFTLSDFFETRAFEDLFENQMDVHLQRMLRRDWFHPHLDIHIFLEHLTGIHSEEFVDHYLKVLIWAVISRRKKLAMYAWQKSMSPLSTAVVASCISNALSNKLSIKETEARQEYEDIKNIFEQTAVNLVDECNKDTTSAQTLVQMKNPTWGNLSTMDIALLATNMAFISTECCQTIVEQRWKKIQSKFILWLSFRALLLALHLGVIHFSLDHSISLLEVVLAVLVFLDFVEKILEFASEQSFKLWGSVWNYYDVVSQITFLVGFLLRFIKDPVPLFIGKLCYSFCGILFTCRLLRLGYIFARLGSKIIIFIKMVPKLLEFLAILMIFLLGYGFAAKALIQHPCGNRDSFQILDYIEDTMLLPYWQMYGELQLDNLESNWTVCQPMANKWTWFATCEICDEEEPGCVCSSSSDFLIWVKVMLAVYLIIGNVLLLNLLIAIFTNVFDSIQKQSIQHWNYEIYRLVRGYEQKPLFPPPVAPFTYLLHGRCNSFTKEEEKFSEVDRSMITLFERQQVRSLQCRGSSVSDIHNIDKMLKSLQKHHNIELLGKLTETLDQIFSTVMSLSRRIDHIHFNLHESQARLEASQEAEIQMLREVKMTQEKLASNLFLQE